MTQVGDASTGTPEREKDAAHKLIQRSRVYEAFTFIAVILISPASFVFGLPLGISPSDWLASWTHWTVIFIAVAIVITVVGFEAALACRLKADRILGSTHI